MFAARERLNRPGSGARQSCCVSRSPSVQKAMCMLKIQDYLILGAAFISLLFSISLWFGFIGLPNKEAGLYFFTKNDGLQNQAPLYVQDGLKGTPRVLIDPNTLSSDGTVALTSSAPSQDGRHLAYGLSTAGSDWNEFRVREIATGKDTTDLIKWVKFSGVSWTADSKGFFYARYAAPTEGSAVFSKLVNRQLYYHVVGTPQSADKLIFELPENPDWNFHCRTLSILRLRPPFRSRLFH